MLVKRLPQILLGIIALSLFACQPSPTPAAFIVTLTLTSTSIPFTPTLANTTSPTLTSTRPPTATPTITPTFPLTLTPKDRVARIKDLLKTNGGCNLPCWWGITPEKTTWIDAKRTLSSLGASFYEDYEIRENGVIQKVFFPGLRTDLSLFHFDMTFDLFVAKDGVVQWIKARSDNYNYRVDKEAIDFVMLWNRYSPQQVLKDYGLPSQVALFVDEGGELYDPHAEIWLLYEEKGLLFIYRGKAMGFRKQDEFFYRVCPVWGNGLMDPFIGIYLRAADNPLPLSRLIYPDVGEPYFFTFTDTTGVSIEGFRNSMLQKDRTICFETPGELWVTR